MVNANLALPDVKIATFQGLNSIAFTWEGTCVVA